MIKRSYSKLHFYMKGTKNITKTGYPKAHPILHYNRLLYIHNNSDIILISIAPSIV